MLEIENVSFPHLQWIYYRQALDGFDKDGNFVQIQHAYFRGEVEFRNKKPDGYLFKDGKHYFYEFRGTIHFMHISYIINILSRLLLAWLFLSPTEQAK